MAIHRNFLEIVDGVAVRRNAPTNASLDGCETSCMDLDGIEGAVDAAVADKSKTLIDLTQFQTPASNASTPPAPPTTRQLSSFDVAAQRVQARDALVGLGWKPHIARTAVDDAMSHVGRDTTLEALIFEALRRCPRPSG